MSIRMQAFGVIGILFFILFAVISAVWFVTDMKKADSVVINLAGRQRMLSQKVSKEALYSMALREAGLEASSVGRQMADTIAVFEITLDALIRSGEAPLTTDPAGKKVMLPAAPDHIAMQLQGVRAMWSPFKDKLLRMDFDPALRRQIVDESVLLLKEMNTAVVLMQEASDKKVSDLRKVLVASGVVSLLVVFFTFRFFELSLLRPLGKLRNFAVETGSGKDVDLDGQGFKGEVLELKNAVTDMTLNLKKTLKEAKEHAQEAVLQGDMAKKAKEEAEEVRELAEKSRLERQGYIVDKLTDIVDRLGRAFEDLHGRISQTTRISEDQKEKSSHTATAIEGISSTVVEVARGAAEAASEAETARQKADESSSVVRSSIEAIEQVRERSMSLKERLNSLNENAQDIGRIMDVINDIADQTNLLALNAAIEAARAGDAGRGFAVVADEVRKLAEKTMDATKEVGMAITSIQQGAGDSFSAMDQASGLIEKAVGFAEDSGSMLGEIIELSYQSSGRIRDIATAAEEQSAATEEISRAGEDVNRTASETSQAMLQSEQAMSELLGLSSEMKKLIAELGV
jgi:methyl-accepting chemotaxis protein/hemerythrin